MKMQCLPEDVLKNVTSKNWRKLYNDFMIIGGMDYAWKPEVMEDFISRLLAKQSKEIGDIFLCKNCIRINNDFLKKHKK